MAGPASAGTVALPRIGPNPRRDVRSPEPLLYAILDILRDDPALARLDPASDRVVAATASAPALVALACTIGEGTANDTGSEAPDDLFGATPITLVITATGREAEAFAETLGAYLDPARIAVFPSWETLPHERLSPRVDTVCRRISALRRLAHPSIAAQESGLPPIRVVVAPIRAVIQPLATGLADLVPITARLGDRLDLTALTASLAESGYSRVDMVESRGDFAVRGGIVDVFVPIDPHPVRIEFFGDEVESIRSFSVADQRSLTDVGRLWAPACRELLLTDGVRAKAAALLPSLPAASDILERVASGVVTEGMESLLPLLADGMRSLVEELPAGTRVVEIEPERLARREEDLSRTAAEFLAAAWSSAMAGAKAPIDHATRVGGGAGAGVGGGAGAGVGGGADAGAAAGAFRRLDDLRTEGVSRGLSWGSLGPFGASGAIVTGIGGTDEHRGQPDRALKDIKARLADGWRVVVAAAGQGSAERLVERCAEEDIPARVQEVYLPVDSVVSVVPYVSGNGWTLPSSRFLVLSESDLTGRASSIAQTGRTPARRRAAVDPVSLRPGDFVVHDQHGIGRFIEMARRTVRGVEREYLVIEYAPSRRGMPGDRLSVPTDHLDRVTKYVGGETPSLSKMGGADWERAKGQARKAVREIAAELIRLYSARMASEGHAFGEDTPWQRELEESFPYIETPDQLATIDEVKADMERPVPMDRLVCGDVGFGKTEIAVRAAFKAVQEGLQVVVLVPTTLLVKQHADTFAGRLAQFPVRIAALSRFQTDKEAREVAEAVADGSVDIVIGTHRVLTGQVRFKRLGLVVIDEEQRFGVEHKETLKAMRTNVDVLAMSATPIPRTLEMAVTGIRELSTLATPPEERLPILTYVGPNEDAQIVAAVRRELLRDGQVFFIHNSVATIGRAASHLNDLVPEARIGIAHGQMAEHQLEQVMVDYYERRYDVLVCTTIVESGLDIPNANTLIVERADKLGLGQLHQLRGRVGRGRERAYAYFLYPPDRTMTETAHDRLQTIAAHTDLGSGTAVAMRDLEIRGAGNLLGAQQSGHIEGVGFDLYMRMVGEAVESFRGGAPEEVTPVTIDLPLDAHIPQTYIGHERLRLEAYRKIAAIEDGESITAVEDELVDRYGEMPEVVRNLFSITALRLDLAARGLSEATVQGRYVRFFPVVLADSAALRVRRLYPGTIIKPAVRQILVPAPTTTRVGETAISGPSVLEWVRSVVGAIAGG
ncbi:MAG: transcription-repair coupling factor [Demequinaceae bacterium]|nr:transcription-repair coupling factor [Demequinaceae bacterium]